MALTALGAGAISAGIGAIGSLFGGNKAKKERKRMERYLNQQDAENTAWYNANYHSDYLQRDDTQNLIRNLRKELDRNNKILANSAVVTGATPEVEAAQKEQANRVISDVYSNIGALGQKWKDNISAAYLGRRADIAGMRMGQKEQQANRYDTLMNNSFNLLGGSVGNMLGSLIKK